MNQMDFGMALSLLRNGERVAREGWNGRDMFIFLVPGSTITVVPDRPLGRAMPRLVGTQIEYCSHIDMKTADGSLVPWVASQTDLLATDWMMAE